MCMHTDTNRNMYIYMPYAHMCIYAHTYTHAHIVTVWPIVMSKAYAWTMCSGMSIFLLKI